MKYLMLILILFATSFDVYAGIECNVKVILNDEYGGEWAPSIIQRVTVDLEQKGYTVQADKEPNFVFFTASRSDSYGFNWNFASTFSKFDSLTKNEFSGNSLYQTSHHRYFALGTALRKSSLVTSARKLVRKIPDCTQ